MLIDEGGAAATHFCATEQGAAAARAEGGAAVTLNAPRAPGRLVLELSAAQVETNAQKFAELAAARASRGMPVAAAVPATGTFARLELNGGVVHGANRSLQNPVSGMTLQRVNAPTITHAEADAVQQAVNQGLAGRGGRAEMWVDRPARDACEPNGRLRLLARDLGVAELVVHGPEGVSVVS